MHASVWENALRRISEASQSDRTFSCVNEFDNKLAIISGKSLKQGIEKINKLLIVILQRLEPWQSWIST